MMITVVGSFVVDLTAWCPHLPAAGETVLGGSFRTGAGGKGSNQAVAAAKLGAKVSIVTKLGKDSFSEIAFKCWNDAGIDYSHTNISENDATGVALISVDENTAQNQIVVASGACMTMAAEEILSAASLIASSDILLLQLEINQTANRAAIEIASMSKTKIILNPAPFSSVPDDLLHLIDYVTPNETEASAWSGVQVVDISTALFAAKAIRSMGPKTVIITLGSSGCLVYESEDSWFVQEAFQVKAVDTTGAGDAFNGGFAYALSNGMELKDAIRFASAVGALSVTKMGTAISMPTKSDVLAFLQNH